jgi:hypothetical protein
VLVAAGGRQGQLELNFLEGHAGVDAPRAKVVNLEARKPIRATLRAAVRFGAAVCRG